MDQTTQQLATGSQPQVATQQIDVNMPNLIQEWHQSRSYVEQYTRDFVSLDQLVDAVPLMTDNKMPFVGDTTLAGLVRSIPRQSLQQLPVFAMVVNGTKYSVPALLCTYIAKSKVFNEDTFGKGLLSTLQIGGEAALTHGYQPFMAALGQLFADYGSTLRMLHYSDTSPEPGIQDANESGYHYVVAHLTPSRVRKILASARNNPATSWNVKALEALLETAPKPTEYSKYQPTTRQNTTGEAMSPSFEFVTRLETEVGATKITFCPDVPDMALRTIESRSKFGYPQVMYLVIDPAPLTPFGVSRVRLASPNQNLMNIYYGQIAAMLLNNSAPPLMKRGRFNGPVELKRNVVWETFDQNADVKLMNMDNGSLQFFPEMAKQFASQIMNIMGGQTQSAPAVDKFSKTAPGTQQAQAFLDVNTNQITKILENFLRQYTLVGVDNYISEQEGVERIIVDDDTKNAINELKPGYVGDDNTVEMNWEEFYAAIKEWKAEITVSLAKDELEDKQRSDLQDMATMIGQNMQVMPPEVQAKLGPLVDSLLRDKAPLVAKTPATAPVAAAQPAAAAAPAPQPANIPAS